MAYKSLMHRKSDAFAEELLEDWWPHDWDDKEWDACLEDWQKEVFGAVVDRFSTWKNEREQQKAEAAVTAS